MRTQKVLAAMLCLVAFNTTASIINNVDFPEEFVQVKEKAKTTTIVHEEVTSTANAKK